MFGGSGKKLVVGLAVTQNLGLEAVVYDPSRREVTKYGKKLIEYNMAVRAIQDFDLFRNAVSDLFNELGLSYNSANIFLVLPNVFFGFKSINDPMVDDEGITSLVSSEAMNSYIFQQEDPICVWADVNDGTGAASKYIAYSAIQTRILDSIQDAMMDIGANLVGVETAVSAIPRGVALTGVCSDEIDDNQNWDILLINQNNYALFQMCGSRLLDYIEVPFAIMSFEGDEVYPSLASAVAQYLPNYPARKLVIISQADNVSAKLLKSAIVFDEKIVAIDSNEQGTDIPVNIGSEVIKQQANTISMGALGAACPKLRNFTTLNTMGILSYDGSSVYGTIIIGGQKREITSSLVRKVCLILFLVLFFPVALIIGVITFLTAGYTQDAQNAQTQIDTLNSQIGKLEEKIKSNINEIIKNISENNVQTMVYYDSLSNDIPSNVWLTYYISKNGKEVGIEGLSLSIQDVYSYFRSLKMLAPSSDIKLNRLDVFQDQAEAPADSKDADQIVLTQTDDSKQQTFTFQISNTSYTKSFDEKGNKAQPVALEGAEGGSGGSSKVPKVPDVDANLKEAD